MADATVRLALGGAARAAVRCAGVDPDALADVVPLLAVPDASGAPDGGPVRSGLTASAPVPVPVPVPVPATGLDLGPSALGELHQSLLDDGHRHRHGVHYTPASVAATLVARALPAGLTGRGRAPLVCDPSCGGGAFLLAAADNLRAGGLAVGEVLERCLHGLDLDPLAVEVTRTALVLWGLSGGLSVAGARDAAGALDAHVVAADALRASWPADGHLDAVVGNPPFAGQLGRATARDADAARAARALLGAPAGLADTAGLFLVRAVAAAAPGARVVLVQPLSFLGARDAGVVRRRLVERAVLEEVWLADERLFGAAVDVCAPTLRVAEALAAPPVPPPVTVTRGPTAEPVAEVPVARLAEAGSWAPVVAAATGVPPVDLADRPRLGTWARATAGFRDEFYALVPFVHDLAGDDEAATDGRAPTRAPEVPALPPGHARLVTAGLVEPARTLWARRPTRLAGRRLRAPAVDVAALRAWATGPDGDRRLATWADARLRPKVVVATQTKVIEAAVDDTGTWWPSVPVVSVVLHPELDDDEHRWLVAAALSAPPVSAWAAERAGGTALAPQAIKLSARQVAEVPLPLDAAAWAEGAAALRLAAAAGEAGRTGAAGQVGDPGAAAEPGPALLEAGRLLTAAHRLPPDLADEVLDWWARRAGCGPAI